MPNEVSAVTRTYDYTLWLLPHIAGFVRQHRFTLGNRLEEGALEILELLIEASYTKEKFDLLRRANLRLERLRYLVRLAKDLKLLSASQYEFSAKALIVIGREIGGWERSQQGPERAEGGPEGPASGPWANHCRIPKSPAASGSHRRRPLPVKDHL